MFSPRYDFRKRTVRNTIAKYCGGLTFVTAVSVLVVYAMHGWSWPSEINGVALNLPQFVVV
ncbi:MAG TPA: hypothetical protein VEG61_03070, partial [Candidatus Dormibacteraeota bacterium]|nr:hypothetical protein [Candidatus Dormibacteraeota bacterium]